MKKKEWGSTVEQPNDRSLNDKAYDLLGELLLEQETNQLLDEIEDEKAQGTTGEMDAFFATHDIKNLKQIHSYFHRQHIKKLLTRTLPKVIQVAAIFIACISIAGGIALATNETVRIYVMKLITTMSDEYTSLKLVKDETASFDVPANWQGNSYPASIPSNLRVFSVDSYVGNNSVEYEDIVTGDIRLIFSEHDSNAETNLDTEGASVCTIMIHSYPGFLAQKKGQISIFWSDGRNYFVLTTYDLEQEDTINIAESVTCLQ